MSLFEYVNRYFHIDLTKSVSDSDELIYGVDNLLPNQILKIVNNSGAAKKATSKIKGFVEADGFLNPDSGKFKVNKTQTADQLLSEIASYISYYTGFALTVTRDMQKVKDVKSIALECVRKLENGNLTYNPLLGQPKYKKTQTTVHPPYFGTLAQPEQLQLITLEKIENKPNPLHGNREIFYVFDKTAASPFYPVPDFFAGIEDLKTSIEFQGIDLDSARNGFMTSGILVTREMDKNTKDDNNKTEYDYFTQVLNQHTGNFKNKYGETNRQSLIHIEVSEMEQAPKWIPFQTEDIIKSTIEKRDHIERNVCRWVGVHPVLCGFSDAQVLGNTQAIANAAKDAMLTVNPLQRMITRAFEQLWPGMDWTVSQFNAWQFIPPEVWDKLPIKNQQQLAAQLVGIELEVENKLNGVSQN